MLRRSLDCIRQLENELGGQDSTADVIVNGVYRKVKSGLWKELRTSLTVTLVNEAARSYCPKNLIQDLIGGNLPGPRREFMKDLLNALEDEASGAKDQCAVPSNVENFGLALRRNARWNAYGSESPLFESKYSCSIFELTVFHFCHSSCSSLYFFSFTSRHLNS